MPGAKGEPDKREVLTAAELPKLGGEVEGIDVGFDGGQGARCSGCYCNKRTVVCQTLYIAFY